jgi:arylsulfatase A-like enzyme/Tfp pilus assembly protein PilF
VHRCIPVAACCIGLALLTGCGRRPAPPPPPSRNLILITVDTLRADRVGVTGGTAALTPALDALGRRGAVFLDATAHVPLTLPSHASILTGRYPTGTGVHDNTGFQLPASLPTLATVLHAAGYHTAAFVSSYVLRGSTGLSRGFDRYDDAFPGAGAARVTLSSLERRAPEVARDAASWLKQAPEPFFLWVHFYDPHAPYDAPPAFASRFPGRPYDAEVATSDFGVGLVLDALDAGRRDRTVVVATGDHGEALGEHGEAEHGILLYDSTLHVPAMIAGPGVPAGTRVGRQVRLVDLMPTALALLGVAAPAALDGESLITLMNHPDAGDAPPSYAESRFGEIHFGWSAIQSVRDGAWKYIDGPAPELYRLSSDRAEAHNELDVRRDTARGLAQALAKMAASAGRAAPAPSADAEARLRSLGYVGGRVSLGSGAGADPKAEIGRYVAYVDAFNRALADLEEGRLAQAETGFRALARDYPQAWEAHEYVARALAGRGAQVEALRELEAALALAPGEPALYFDEARSLAALKQFDRAFEQVAAGLRLEPASFDGWLTRGLVARAAGQAAAAQEAFEEALTINPQLAVAHFELGQLAEARGDRVGATREYQLALERDTMLQEARDALERIRQ